MRAQPHDSPASAATAGTLYVVATPIGNPDDLSPHAARVLGQVDLVACEDTRRTGLLLARMGLSKPMVSYFEHNEQRRADELVARLRTGQNVALVTDAGTPAISDPGYRLVRAAWDAEIPVRAVAGPSAAVTALSIAGLPTDRFVFEGFLPVRDNERKRALEQLANEPRTMVFFETARRLPVTVAAMAQIFGRERLAAVVREISKTHEEVLRATLGELTERLAQNPVLGEVTLVIDGTGWRRNRRKPAQELTIESLREAGLTLGQAAAVLARLGGTSRGEVYRQAVTSGHGETAKD